MTSNVKKKFISGQKIEGNGAFLSVINVDRRADGINSYIRF